MGFRGLYRTNSRGQFNVPFGNYKNPEIFELDNLQSLSILFQKVEFQHLDVYNLNIPTSTKYFIYMDPPYNEETQTSFTMYDKSKFTKESTTKLKDICKKHRGCFLLSNSNTQFVLDLFKEFTIEPITCRRRINSKNPNMKTIEVLIT